jgi:hypothetical protein
MLHKKNYFCARFWAFGRKEKKFVLYLKLDIFVPLFPLDKHARFSYTNYIGSELGDVCEFLILQQACKPARNGC